MSLRFDQKGWIQMTFEVNSEKDGLILKQIARQHRIVLFRTYKKAEFENYAAYRLPSNPKLITHFLESICDKDGGKLFKHGFNYTREEMIADGHQVLGNTELFIHFYQSDTPRIAKEML